MELFNREVNSKANLLPYDGVVNYHGKIFDRQEADQLFERLLSDIAWERDVAIIFGKRIETKRKVAWYGDLPFEYTYSNNTKTAQPWTDELLFLKDKAEVVTNETYNSCLLNLYHDGSEGMAWHRDEEDDLKKDGAIASITLGAERKFAFKHRQTKETVSTFLEHGSLLVMKGTTQTHWLHRLPPTKKVHSPRVNLTFRTIVE
ncbi:MAG: alpha-ketoglutarate-dependent dioxygenase AlkB [Flammeovirgaceae bacterium]|nr:alpha-ketoglutarate-dependent dioxygenase AlkB [Flammeovirgaceae bacterium]|tara:strand:+ start:2030 stop:2638 length:609 start_codon:yes stop_codon:yes gene_type:complete